MRTYLIALFYILFIFVFATAYFLMACSTSREIHIYWDALYFSVVTMTTLGYGDIVPITGWAKLLVSVQVLFGLVLIGLFLNSLWKTITDQIEVAQKRTIKESIRSQNTSRLAAYIKVFEVEAAKFELVLYELTTPIEQRQAPSKPNANFLFSDLKSMFLISLDLRNGLERPMITVYYDGLNKMLAEIRFLISNFDLSDNPNLRDLLMDFLEKEQKSDVRGALLSYTQQTPENEEIRKILVNIITDHDECPKEEDFPKNIALNVIVLFHLVRFQISQIRLLLTESESIRRRWSER